MNGRDYTFFIKQDLIHVGPTNHIEYNYTNVREWPNVVYFYCWFGSGLYGSSNLYSPFLIEGKEMRFINCTHYPYKFK